MVRQQAPPNPRSARRIQGHHFEAARSASRSSQGTLEVLVDSPCAKAGGGGEDGERCNDGCHGDGLDERCQTCLFYPRGAAQLLDQFSLQGAADDFVSSAELCSLEVLWQETDFAEEPQPSFGTNSARCLQSKGCELRSRIAIMFFTFSTTAGFTISVAGQQPHQ